MTNILLWFLLGYCVWRLLRVVFPIRAQIVVRKRPVGRVEGLLFPAELGQVKEMSSACFESFMKARFVQISSAFASGEIHYIKNFVTDKVYQMFQQVIAERQKNGHTMDFKLVDFRRVQAESGEQRWVEFETEQVNVLKDKENHVIEGDPMYLSLVREKWQFKWDAQKGWLLSAIQTVDAHAV